MYLFFSLSFRCFVLVHLVLWPLCDSKPCILYWYIYLMRLLLHFHLSLHVLFLFSHYTHASYLCMQSFNFCFTLRCLDEFCLKCEKYRLSKSIMPWTLFLHSFSRVCVMIRFYCIQQVNISWVIYDFSHISFVCCGFVTDFQRGRLLGHMWKLLCTYVI